MRKYPDDLWFADLEYNSREARDEFIVWDSKFNRVAVVRKRYDAAAIAAVPEMYRALEAAADLLERYDRQCELMWSIRELLQQINAGVN